MFRDICKQADVPVQTFTNRSDIAGGSTLGNISNTGRIQYSGYRITSAGQHSPYETPGSKDTEYLVQAAQEFFLLAKVYFSHYTAKIPISHHHREIGILFHTYMLSIKHHTFFYCCIEFTIYYFFTPPYHGSRFSAGSNELSLYHNNLFFSIVQLPYIRQQFPIAAACPDTPTAPFFFSGISSVAKAKEIVFL